jgi:16S rRNA U516 pseudouridylate synthase RsuA-like enzyme
LVRARIGDFALEPLAPGAWCELGPAERSRVFSASL